jgi:archaeal type IV pilus assembly protein PilA
MNEWGVSEVVGEMLMIGLVLMVVAVFSSTLSSFLPVERSPSITVMVTNDTLGNITFWHKGGDWVKVSDLKVIVKNSSTTLYFPDSGGGSPPVTNPPMTIFEVGSGIRVHLDKLEGNESVKMGTSRTVLFSGTLGDVGQ